MTENNCTNCQFYKDYIKIESYYCILKGKFHTIIENCEYFIEHHDTVYHKIINNIGK